MNDKELSAAADALHDIAIRAVEAWVNAEYSSARNTGKGGPGEVGRCTKAERKAREAIAALATHAATSTKPADGVAEAGDVKTMPPLPKSHEFVVRGIPRYVFTADQMHDYGQQCAQLARQQAPVGDSAYIECRECEHCGHIGINDSSDTQAACHNCDWSGPTPQEDNCPGCADTNCMGAACPKCSSIYKLIADTHITAWKDAQLARERQGEPVYFVSVPPNEFYNKGNGWLEVDAYTWSRTDPTRRRTLYATPAAQAQGEPVGEVMAKPDNEHGTLTWPRVVWSGGLFAMPPVGTKLYLGPAPQADEVRDAARYRWLRDKSEPGICAFYLSVGQAFKNVKFARETVDEAIDAQIEAERHTAATNQTKGE